MKNLLNFRPLLFIAISLCCGISVAYFVMRNFIVWGIIFSLVFAVCITLFLTLFSKPKTIKRNCIFALVFIMFFAFGITNFSSNVNAYTNADLGGHYYTVTGRVTSVNQTDSGVKLIIENVQIKGNVSGNLRYKVAVNVYGGEDFGIGDIITFSEYLIDKSYIYENNFNASDLERQIKYSADVYYKDITVSGSSPTVFERINLFIRDVLNDGLDKEEFAVAYAMLTGEDGYMDYDLLQSYRTAGVAHIFAVSGLHIGFLATALSFLFSKLRIRGYLKAIIITLALIFYSGVCGFSASSLRATVMTAVMLFAMAKGQRYDGLSALAFAAILILCVSPIQLFCVGFQLSFSVVIGMNLLSSPISKLFKFLPQKLASALGAVLSAQIVAIPISLYSFGYFSWISIAVNIIFIPIVSVIFIFTLLSVIVGGIFLIPHITLFVPNYIFKVINFIIGVFDSNLFVISGFVLGSGIIAYYLAVVILGGLIRLKLRVKAICSIVLVFICTLTSIIYTIGDTTSIKLYVSGSKNISATFIKDGIESTLIVSNVNYVYSTGRLKRIADAEKVNVITNLIFMGGYPVDMQVFITKLRTVFEVENVYYYGERDAVMENIVKKSFSKVNLKNYIDGQDLLIKSFDCKFAFEGNALIGKIAQKKMVVFSSFSKQFSFVGLDNDFDIMICCDGAESILSRYKPKIGVSYRHSSSVLNAESTGNLNIKIN